MPVNESNAERFLNAFATIENILTRQQTRSDDEATYTPFKERVSNSDALLRSQKEQLYDLANLRNVIAHNRYFDNKPIADPRADIVSAIAKIQELLEKPPLLKDALRQRRRLKVFAPTDDITEFLELVTTHNFSQAPVKTDSGYELISTNAVARWFASNLISHGGVIESTLISEVLEFAETGDRLKPVNPSTTTVQAINIFSGQAEVDREPPAALLVLGQTGQLPQVLCVRADLSLLYAQLET